MFSILIIAITFAIVLLIKAIASIKSVDAKYASKTKTTKSTYNAFGEKRTVVGDTTFITYR